MRSNLNWLPSKRNCGCSNNALNCLDTDEWLRYQDPIWRFGKKELRGSFEHYSRQVHPAVFPRVLAQRIINLFTHRGETVLDMFSGAGTTLVSAMELGRNAVGMELNPLYTALAKRRIAYMGTAVRENQKRLGCRLSVPLGHQFTTDARDLVNYFERDSIDLILTSPPYWDLLKQRQSKRNRLSGKHLKKNYSNDKRDLSNQEDLDGFLGEMNGILNQARLVLKRGGRLVLITGDYRRRGKYISLHNKYISTLNNMGLKLNNIFIWDRSNEYDIGLYCYPEYFIAANGMVEYILEFEK